MRRLGALEALGRGISNVRGNLEVVGIAAAGTIVLLAIVLATLIPWLGLSQDELGGLFRVAMGQGQVSDLPALFRNSWTIVNDFWGLVLALSVGLTVASIAYSWYYGGILGVLFAGDAQAPPGAGRSAELFRTWSARLFVGEASRLTWRVFWFVTLWITVFCAVATLLVVAVAVAAMVGKASGGLAAVAVGCGAALPLLFAFFVAFAAMSLGQVALVPAESGVIAASKAGLGVLGRRFLATTSLVVLFAVAAVALGAVEAGVGVALVTALAGAPAAAMAAQVALGLVQILLSALLNVVFVAALVALVRSERRLAADATA